MKINHSGKGHAGMNKTTSEKSGGGGVGGGRKLVLLEEEREGQHSRAMVNRKERTR